MASERAAVAAALCAVAMLGAGVGRPALAQPAAPRTAIYSCIDATGKRIIAASPIPGCRDREQRELNPDGSTKRIVPPVPTAEERAAAEQRERDEKQALQVQNDAIRRDRNLINRFPSEERHQKAREKALDDARTSVRNSEARLEILRKERIPLLEERAFYINEHVNKPLPPSLKQKLDANEAAQKATESSIQNASAEVIRINALYDAELARLKKLWAGAPAGSVPVASDLQRTNLR